MRLTSGADQMALTVMAGKVTSPEGVISLAFARACHTSGHSEIFCACVLTYTNKNEQSAATDCSCFDMWLFGLRQQPSQPWHVAVTSCAMPIFQWFSWHPMLLPLNPLEPINEPSGFTHHRKGYCSVIVSVCPVGAHFKLCIANRANNETDRRFG